jgi:hypothetical protein
MRLDFTSIIVTKVKRTAGGKRHTTAGTLSVRDAKARARRVLRASRAWADGEPRFKLSGDSLVLCNPKAGMQLALNPEVFGLRLWHNVGSFSFKLEDFD